MAESCDFCQMPRLPASAQLPRTWSPAGGNRTEVDPINAWDVLWRLAQQKAVCKRKAAPHLHPRLSERCCFAANTIVVVNGHRRIDPTKPHVVAP